MTRTAILSAFLVVALGIRSVPAFATDPAPCPDLNADGVVNVADITIEASYLGQMVPPAPPQADMNEDGRVDNADLVYFYPPLIPEPTWITTCQGSPIGPASAVGGIAELPDVAPPDTGFGWAGWLAIIAAALAASVSCALMASILRRRNGAGG